MIKWMEMFGERWMESRRDPRSVVYFQDAWDLAPSFSVCAGVSLGGMEVGERADGRLESEVGEKPLVLVGLVPARRASEKTRRREGSIAEQKRETKRDRSARDEKEEEGETDFSSKMVRIFLLVTPREALERDSGVMASLKSTLNWYRVGMTWLKLTVLMKGLTERRLTALRLFLAMARVILRGALEIPATTAKGYLRVAEPFSWLWTMTALVPAWRPLRRMTTFPGLRLRRTGRERARGGRDATGWEGYSQVGHGGMIVGTRQQKGCKAEKKANKRERKKRETIFSRGAGRSFQ